LPSSLSWLKMLPEEQCGSPPISVPPACDVQHGPPVAADGSFRALTQPRPDLREQALPLPGLHRDVAGECFEQLDVLVRAVHLVPVEVPKAHDLEEPARLDLVGVFLKLPGPRPRG